MGECSRNFDFSWNGSPGSTMSMRPHHFPVVATGLNKSSRKFTEIGTLLGVRDVRVSCCQHEVRGIEGVRSVRALSA